MSKILSRTQSLFLMVVVFFMAFATRLHNIEVRSFWADEGWTLDLGAGPNLFDVVIRMTNDMHPPLFFIFFNYWEDMVGQSEFALRILPTLIGIIGIAVVYQLGKQLFSVEAGVLAAIIIMLSDHHIDMSQELRHYTQLTLMISLSTLFYYRLATRDNPSWTTRIGYIVFATAGLYTHYISGLVLIIHLVHMLIFVRPFKKLVWTGIHWGIGCAFFLPWLPVVREQNSIRWVDPLHYQNSMPNTRETFELVRNAVLTQQYAIFIILIALGAVYTIYRQQRVDIKLQPFAPIALMLMWFIGMGGLPFVLEINDEHPFLTTRIFLIVIPPMAILAGHGLANMPVELRNFMTLILVIVGLTTVDAQQVRPPWREVTQNITEFHNEGEPVIMDIWVGDWPVRYYIDRQMGDDVDWMSVRVQSREQGDQFLPYVANFIQDEDAFWLIYWGENQSEEGYENLFRDQGFQLTANPYEWHEGSKIYSYRYDRVSEDILTTYQDESGEIFALQKAALNGNFESGETITATLWWRALMEPPTDYSVSVFIINAAGQLITQSDGPPLNGEAQTSTWKIGRLQYDQHDLVLPDNLPAGNYQVGVKMYFYQVPDFPLQTPCDGEDGLCDWFTVGSFEIN